MKKLLLILLLLPTLAQASFKVDDVKHFEGLSLVEKVIDDDTYMGYKLETLVYDVNSKCYNLTLKRFVKYKEQNVYISGAEKYNKCLNDLDFDKLDLPEIKILKDKQYTYAIINDLDYKTINIIKFNKNKLEFDKSLKVNKNIYLRDAILTSDNNIFIVGGTTEDSGSLLNQGGLDAFILIATKDTGDNVAFKATGEKVDDYFVKALEIKNGIVNVLSKGTNTAIHRITTSGKILSKKRFQNTSYNNIVKYHGNLAVIGSEKNKPSVIAYDNDEEIVFEYKHPKYNGKYLDIKAYNNNYYLLAQIELKTIDNKVKTKYLVERLSPRGKLKAANIIELDEKPSLIVDDYPALLSGKNIYLFDRNLNKFSKVDVFNKAVNKENKKVYTTGGVVTLKKETEIKPVQILLGIGVILIVLEAYRVKVAREKTKALPKKKGSTKKATPKKKVTSKTKTSTKKKTSPKKKTTKKKTTKKKK